MPPETMEEQPLVDQSFSTAQFGQNLGMPRLFFTDIFLLLFSRGLLAPEETLCEGCNECDLNNQTYKGF